MMLYQHHHYHQYIEKVLQVLVFVQQHQHHRHHQYHRLVHHRLDYLVQAFLLHLKQCLVHLGKLHHLNHQNARLSVYLKLL